MELLLFVDFDIRYATASARALLGRCLSWCTIVDGRICWYPYVAVCADAGGRGRKARKEDSDDVSINGLAIITSSKSSTVA